MKASHTFNLLDARRAISVTERQRYILRALARRRWPAYYEQREKLGFPGAKKPDGPHRRSSTPGRRTRCALPPPQDRTDEPTVC
jgi:hypothetical protein